MSQWRADRDRMIEQTRRDREARRRSVTDWITSRHPGAFVLDVLRIEAIYMATLEPLYSACSSVDCTDEITPIKEDITYYRNE